MHWPDADVWHILLFDGKTFRDVWVRFAFGSRASARERERQVARIAFPSTTKALSLLRKVATDIDVLAPTERFRFVSSHAARQEVGASLS